MRYLKLLQLSMGLLYITSILMLAFIVGMYIYMLISPAEIMMPIVNGTPQDFFDFDVHAVALSTFTGFGFFIYGLHWFRRVLSLFSDQRIFELEAVKYLQLTGKYFFIAACLSSIPLYIYKMFVHNEVTMTFGIEGVGSFIFSFGISLFFIALAEVFSMAIKIKEENGLTI